MNKSLLHACQLITNYGLTVGLILLFLIYREHQFFYWSAFLTYGPLSSHSFASQLHIQWFHFLIMATTILIEHNFRNLLLRMKLMGYICLVNQLTNPRLFQKLHYLNHSHRTLILSLAMISSIHIETIQQPQTLFMLSLTLERFRILGLSLTNYSLNPKVKFNYSPLTLRANTFFPLENSL